VWFGLWGNGAKFYALYALTRRFAPPSPEGERLSFAFGRGPVSASLSAFVPLS
jgi:hypothetical protein